jgi:mono/diheme cytochrome c family protein
MRKMILPAIIFSFIVALAYLSSCKSKSAENKHTTVNVDSFRRLDRGRYLVEHVAGCIDCHSKRDFTKYSGPVVAGTEYGGGLVFDEHFGLPGIIYGRNISSDVETGIGAWTDEEIMRAITQGINKNGDTLFPLMPYTNYNRMAKEDLLSIIAFIRTVKPIKNEVPTRALKIPIALAYPAKFLQPSVDNNPMPAETDLAKYGEYLITFADCGTCHSPLTAHGPDMSRMYAGGYTFVLPTNKVTSANITPDTATGIGSWTEERFLAKFTTYRDPKNYDYDPGKQNTIMPLSVLAGMTDNHLRAIYAYLRTVRPQNNMVMKFPQQ